MNKIIKLQKLIELVKPRGYITNSYYLIFRIKRKYALQQFSNVQISTLKNKNV